MGSFVNSSHLTDIVHFQDLSLTFDRTDPYIYFDISYDAFRLSFPWLRNSDAQYSISQKLMDRGKNAHFSLRYACCSIKAYNYLNLI